MNKVALLVRHTTKPGQRDAVHTVWQRHMQPNIARNPGHEAYFYCFDPQQPEAICAFQQFTDLQASRDFLTTASYAAYLKEVEPLLAGPPELSLLDPVWIKSR